MRGNCNNNNNCPMPEGAIRNSKSVYCCVLAHLLGILYAVQTSRSIHFIESTLRAAYFII